MENGLYAGSFDPITLGHIDIIKQSHHLFNKLYVVISYNSNKSGLFTPAERATLAKTALKDYSNVEVITSDALTIKTAQELQANFLVRGVRGSSDLDMEMAMANLNHAMAEAVHTILIPATGETQAISSSMIKEIAKVGGDVSKFVPMNVAEALHSKFSEE